MANSNSNKMICRGCLSDNQELLNSLLNNPTLLSLYTSCTQLKININDNLPKNLCSNCINQCVSWDSFKQMCTINESVLFVEFGELKCGNSPAVEMLEQTIFSDDMLDVEDQVKMFLNSSTEFVDTKTLNVEFEEVTIKNEILSSDEYGLRDEIPNNNNGIQVIGAEMLLDDQTTEIIYLDSDDASSIKGVQMNEINNPQQDEEKFQTTTVKKRKNVIVDCPNCDRTFFSKATRARHIKNNVCQLKCSVCGEIFKTLSEKRSHGLIHSTIWSHKCQICDRGFTQIQSLTRHMRLVHTKIFQCEKCDKTFASNGLLKLHLKSHLETSNMCSVCGKTLANRRKLKLHMDKHTEGKIFQCDICDKRITTKYQIRKHMTIHTGETPYPCSMCDKSFRQRSQLKYHLISHEEDNRPAKCTKCNKSYKIKARLSEHMRQHTGERPYTCKICLRSFFTSTTLRQHSFIHSDVKPFKCEFCDRQFYRKDNLALHTRTHTGEKLQKHKCTMCVKEFIYKWQLRQHMECHTDEKPFNCTMCQLSFGIEDNLRSHLMKDHEPAPCSICKDVFDSKTILRRHMQEIHDVRYSNPNYNKEYAKRRIECPVCKKLIQLAYKATHMKIHSEPTYKCKLCAWSFATGQGLSQHMLSHSNAHPFKCEYCVKSFKRKSDVIEHTRLHTGQAPTCKLCNKVYTHDADFIVHMRSHTGEKPFECTVCGEAFDSKPKLKKHSKKHENEPENN